MTYFDQSSFAPASRCPSRTCPANPVRSCIGHYPDHLQWRRPVCSNLHKPGSCALTTFALATYRHQTLI